MEMLCILVVVVVLACRWWCRGRALRSTAASLDELPVDVLDRFGGVVELVRATRLQLPRKEAKSKTGNELSLACSLCGS